MAPSPEAVTGRKSNLIPQISTNLSNTLATFGPTSAQYAAVLEMLRDSIRELELEGKGEEEEMQEIAVLNSGSRRDEGTTADVIEGLRELLKKGLKM
ncbi:hypothetical protein ACJ72_05576 [Emergomyces africanus]|uniref:Uncharacterized protein n=1 Tax=Emergomyces africanus TaxID=1955775 RepID=A0A1B7NTH0_9EURO|nr:hypothetical protein ACJ72_05576 [Emergomyces africanus]